MSRSLHRGVFWAASLLFFASGVTGLAYEVIWFKRFAHVWGSSNIALAAVVASFLCGLGIGAHLIGRRADHVAQPLRWYGWSELGIGALALLVPWELHVLAMVGVRLDQALPLSPALRFFVQFLVTLLVIGPPCVLMGGTLPLLVRQFSAQDESLSESTGWFYALNTFGAAVGCLLSGFLLLPTWGLLATNNLTALGNLAVGGMALRLTNPLAARGKKGQSHGASDRKEAAAPIPTAAISSLRVYFAAALAGAAALVLQIVWNRQLAVTLGGSTYAFSSTLFVVLFSIALGSLLYHWRLKRYGNSPYLYAAVILVIAVGVLAGQFAWPALCRWAGSAKGARASATYNAWLCIAIGSAMQLVPSLGGGVLFPLLAQWTRERGASAGRVIGNLYAWNTLGAILGATCTAMALFPTIGTAGATGLAVALYVASLLVLQEFGNRRAIGTTLAYAVVGGALAWVASRPIDPRETNTGYYMYGVIPTDYNVKFFREGPASNVMVGELRNVSSLRVNGKVDASTGIDMETQLGLAYFARLFRPDAREVAVIGFGSGATSGASALFPDTRVVCCEIEPAVYAAAPHFAEVNHKPYESPQFSLVIADGRSYIQSANRTFDLIVSEPSNPWLAGVSNLFTRDFFTSVRERLGERGVFVQWVQTYNFSIAEYALILRTMRTVFPHVSLVTLAGGADTLIIASASSLDRTPDQVAQMQTLVDGSAEIQKDLDKYFGAHNVQHLLLAHYALDEEGIKRLLAADPQDVINTDLNMRLEFDAPLRLFQVKQELAFAVNLAIKQLRNPAMIERLAGQMGLDRNSAACRLALAKLHREQSQSVAKKDKAKFFDDARAELEAARHADPASLEVLAELGSLNMLTGKLPEALESYQEALKKGSDTAAVNTAIGSLLLQFQRPAESLKYMERAIELDPHQIISLNNVAWVLSTVKDDSLRDGQRALELAEQACAATSYSQPELLDTMAAALAELKRFDEAIDLTKQALARTRQSGRDTKLLEARLKQFQAGQPVRE